MFHQFLKEKKLVFFSGYFQIADEKEEEEDSKVEQVNQEQLKLSLVDSCFLARCV
jgi:hypothetical protein